jgi:hypothetical protein
MIGLGQSPSSPVKPPATPPLTIATHPEWPKAKPEDVASVDAIIAAVGDVLSGPAGSQIDLDRFRSLFIPGGRLAITLTPPPGRPPQWKTDITLYTIEDYAAYLNGIKAKNGSYEETLAKHIDSFGDMTHVYATFELKAAKDASKPLIRGINSFELLHSGDRYYIVQIYWNFERTANPIPTMYLPSAP